MGTIDWNHPRSWAEVCRRHAARRRRVLELVVALGGLHRGAQSRIAAALGVHRSTVCKDLRRLLPLAAPCPACGSLRPRERWEKA